MIDCMHSSMQLVLLENWRDAVKVTCNDSLHLAFEQGNHRFVITAGTNEEGRAKLLAFLQQAMLVLMEADIKKS